MARANAALLVLLLGCLGAAQARLAPEAGATTFGRALLQDCSRIPNCATCTNRRVGGVTQLLCTSCAANYATTEAQDACACAPGYSRASASDDCTACGTGAWCAGGVTGGRTECGTGQTTLIDTATRAEQCVTTPGFGMASDGSAAECAVGSFSAGGTRNPCRACGAGLTTAATASTSSADCSAPAGYYFDKNAAKPCPKGTYKAALSRATSCTACAEGVTTSATASTAASDCALAKRGYFTNATNVAYKCAANSFQPVQGAAVNTACTACPPNMVTKAAGAATRTACVAPKGFGYVDDTTGAVECDYATFKAGANRRACVACGSGFNTTGTGKTSFADCFIYQGWGTTKVGAAFVAAQCAQGFYGAAAATFGVKNLPCTPCATGMSTDAAGASLPEDCKTTAGYGYDQATQSAQLCAVGTWSAGGGRDECASCGLGYTTASTGSSSSSDCVIAPGYGYTGASSDPEPCPQGSFGVGMNATAACASCSGQTWTTKDALATSQDDCTVCVAGYGGAGCGACPAGSYSAGGSATCSSCPAGTTSPAASGGSDDCVSTWTKLNPAVDTIPVDAAASYVASTSQASAADCKAACGAACMFYAYNATAGTCLVAGEITGSDANIMFKSAPTKYTVWGWNSAVTSIGATLATPSAGSADACADACDAADSCVGAVYKSGVCRLIAAAADSDISACEIQAIGTQMNVAPLS